MSRTLIILPFLLIACDSGDMNETAEPADMSGAPVTTTEFSPAQGSSDRQPASTPADNGAEPGQPAGSSVEEPADPTSPQDTRPGQDPAGDEVPGSADEDPLQPLVCNQDGTGGFPSGLPTCEEQRAMLVDSFALLEVELGPYACVETLGDDGIPTEGVCACVPQCDGKACGHDSCPGADGEVLGSCGSCGDEQICHEGACLVCVPGEAFCASDTLAATCNGAGTGSEDGSSVDCSDSFCENGACACVPSCGVGNCGDDGCGGSCPPEICDDGNPCTEDACEMSTGNCSNLQKNCDDGDLCTNDSCDNGACKFTAKNCNDGFACTVDSCNPNGGSCVNQDACTDNLGCTDDYCDGHNGCVSVSNCPGGQQCCPDGTCKDGC